MSAPRLAAPPAGELLLVDDVGPPRRGRRHPGGGAALALLLPALLMLGLFLLVPVLLTVRTSLTDAGGHFAGWANFAEALRAHGTAGVFGRTLLWAVAVPGVVVALGLLLAAVPRRSTGSRLAGLLVMVPAALPLVVTGATFRLFYDPDPGRGLGTGVLSALCGLLGVPGAARPLWLGRGLITVALMSAFVWAWAGLAMVVFRHVLAAVPGDLADAVRAAGGSRWDVFRDAVWRPLLRRTTTVVFVLVALATARTFDLILVMTPGSSLSAASVLAVRVWQTSGAEPAGPGAALGVLWLLAVGAAMAGAAVGSRQRWPPPRRPEPPAVPAGRPAEPGGRGVSGHPADSGRHETGTGHLRWRVAGRRVLHALTVAVWVAPVAALLATSLHGVTDAATREWWAAPVGAGSYRAALRDGELLRSLWFTATLATLATLAVLAVALLAAYALAWLHPPGLRLAGVALLAAAVVPVQVVARPVTDLLRPAGVAGTALGLGLVHVALGVPFAILVLRNALADLPHTRLRAARLSGGPDAVVLWRLVPGARQAIAGLAVLEFVQVWNDLVVGLLFAVPTTGPVGPLIFGQTREVVSNAGPIAAQAVLVSVLPVLLVVAARRQVVAALTTGTAR